VRHKGGFFFAEAIGESSEAEANRTVNLKADRFLSRLVGGDDAALIEKSASWPELSRQAAATGIGEKVECAKAWNNQGQQISYSGKPFDSAVASVDAAAARVEGAAAPSSEAGSAAAAAQTPPATLNGAQGVGPEQASVRASTPKSSYEAEYQAKLRAWEQQQAEHKRSLEAHEEALRHFEAKKVAQREQMKGVLGRFEQQLAQHTAAEDAYAEERRRWEAATQQAEASRNVADAFKVQNDAEWKKVLHGLPAPRVFTGATWAYCYQPSLVDSTLYESEIFTTNKTVTELELVFADEVAKKTRIGSAMSTYCRTTVDATWLAGLAENVRKVHANLKTADTPIRHPSLR
jgi:hypothetical protein